MATKITTSSYMSIIAGAFSLAMEGIDAYETPADMATDVTSGVSTVLNTLGSVSTGGQANTVNTITTAAPALSAGLTGLIAMLATLFHPAAKAAAPSTT